MRYRGLSTGLLVALVSSATPMVCYADFRIDTGYYELIERIGAENMPTGDGVAVAQVEASEGGTNYAPNTSDPEISGHTFIDRSSGSPASSSHATTVARWFYGSTVSMAPLADDINLYEATGWVLDDFLRSNYSSSTAPLSMPAGIKVLNNSWIGSFGNVNNDQIVLRRMDYVVNRDQAIIVVGVNNGDGAAHQPLLAYGFNNISVGVRSGNHASGDISSYEGSGRMLPLICAPGELSSWSTAIVSSAVVMLVDQVRDDPDLHTDGQKSEVVKAVILAAADHQDSGADDGSWSNNPSDSGVDRGTTIRPLDPVQGAGQVDVDRGHLIMGNGRIIGGVSPATTPEAALRGWDRSFCLNGNARTWNFTLGGMVEEVSIVAAWNRQVPVGFGSTWTLGDFDLELVQLDLDDNPVSLVGAGPEVFGSGNVLSSSAVDNVEHLYIRNLAPGRYQLRLSLEGGGVANSTAGIAWYFSDPEIVDVPGDINGDGAVNVDDLLQLLSEYGQCNGSCDSDLDGDGDSDVDDLLQLLQYMS
ncbi:MAG: hypothetical protein CMJ39_12480 [Phycisphaerae bacterium]|nr:hypothetical protein [Phycisphaerae bacterium]